ncbi:hypothetical protein [uncultured Tenacibaculum sp.]|uniref:hypothetical protein n=1 Tax=uncultured Tenacibaculum sp. TaxID=174713 RepID=UPI002605B85D|nr:hypothetical protein [uncultured Tenacibaculum sp.]
MKKSYRNQKEIAKELKKLKLQRKIAFEEIKLIKHEFKEDVSINNWITTTIKTITRIGVFNLVRKIVR